VGAGGLGNASAVEVRQGQGGAWQAVATAGVTRYGCGIVVPPSFSTGPFDVRVEGGTPFTANVPRPW